jgi:hypothetical protein
MSIAEEISCTVRYLTIIFDRICLCPVAVRSEWHTAFDVGKWILLPDADTLAEVYHYVKSAIAWRRDPASGLVEDFASKAGVF